MALPIVRLTEISDEGLVLDCDVMPEEIALAGTDAQVHDTLSVSADLHKTGTIVAVHGSVSGTFVRQCVRCLKDYDIFVRVPFTAEYHIAKASTERGKGLALQGGAGPTDERAQLGEYDQDVYDYDGEQVDLTAMLREQVILATPMQPLCDEGCLGLCPVCGQDLNEQSCACPEQIQPSPFSPLQQLREQLGDPRRRLKSDPQRN